MGGEGGNSDSKRRHEGDLGGDGAVLDLGLLMVTQNYAYDKMTQVCTHPLYPLCLSAPPTGFVL